MPHPGPRRALARLLPLALLVPLAGCHSPGHCWSTIRGSGVAAEETREVGTFRRLDVGGALDVHVTVGEDGPLHLSGDDNVLPLVRTRVQGDELVVDLDGHSVSLREPLVLHCSVRSLEAVRASGAVDVVVEGLDAERFALRLSGASDVRLHGRADELEARASGASDLELFDLAARRVDLRLSGASSVHVAAHERLSVRGSGASHVSYRGRPVLDVSLSGASSVRAVDGTPPPVESPAVQL